MQTRFRSGSRVLVLLIAVAALALAACQPSTAEMVNKVNVDRTRAGVGAVKENGELNAKAQAHAQQLARAGRLWHSDVRAGVSGGYQRLGEIVGAAGEYDAVHSLWLRSSSHRAHLLGGGYTEMGSGSARGADGRLYVVQVFKG